MRPIESFHEIGLIRENLKQKLEKSEQQISSRTTRLINTSQKDITRLLIRKGLTMAVQYILLQRRKHKKKTRP